MDISSANFEKHYSRIEESIKTADFISIDTEFSGWTVSAEDQGHEFDSIED